LVEPTRRVVVGIGGAAFVLIALGIAAIVFDYGFAGGSGPASHSAGSTAPGPSSPPIGASPTARPSAPGGSGIPASSTPPVSSSPSASIGPTGHPVGFLQEGKNVTYYAADGSTVPVQPVPGLEVRLQSGRAIYYALASNKFNLKAGSYAGEFMSLVTMGQADGSSAVTGGCVLDGHVVSKLISDSLAAIQSDSDRWIVALPVDIRSSQGSPVDVSFDQFGLAGWSNTPRVMVRFAGSLKVVDTIPTNSGYHVLVEELGVTSWQVIDPQRLALETGAIDPAHAMNELLVYGSGTPNVQHDVLFDKHVLVGQPMLSATSDVSVSLVVNGSRAALGPEKVLTIGDVPVFVASNS